MWGGKNKIVPASLSSVSSPLSSPLTGWIALRNEEIPSWSLEYCRQSQSFLKGGKSAVYNDKIGRVKCDNKRTQQEILDTSVDWNAYRRGLEASSSHSHLVGSLLKPTTCVMWKSTWVNVYFLAKNTPNASVELQMRCLEECLSCCYN